MSGEVRLRRVRQAVLVGLISLMAFPALLPTGASASYNPLAGGATKLTLDKSFLVLLKQHDVKIAATAGARLRTGRVTFPVSGGKLDPVDSRGTVEHEGALVFEAGSRRIILRALSLKTTRPHSPLSVKVGGGQLKLAQAKELVVSRRGFDSEIKVDVLRLSAKVVTRLAKKLGLRGVLKPGQPIGSTVTRVSPLTVALMEGGRVNLNLDPGFSAKLQSLYVAVNPIFPGEHPGPFTLPIFGGTLATDASIGSTSTLGSLEFLQLGGGQVFWHEPSLDFAGKSLIAEAEVDPSPPYGGKLGPVQIATLSLGSVSADAKSLKISVAGALSLSAPMAATFNQVFANPQGKEGVFQPGESVASVSFTARSL